MGAENKKYIFYHAYLINNWYKLIADHLKAIKDSGLLHHIDKIFFGINYKNDLELTKFHKLLSNFPKSSIIFQRNNVVPGKYRLPIKDKLGNYHLSSIELGEGETIMALCDFATTVNVNSTFYFFHTKGVTLPEFRPGTFLQFKKVARWMNTSEPYDKESANELMHQAIIRLIYNWRDIDNSLLSSDYYYFIWNIFSINSNLLSSFSWEKWFSASYTRYFSNQQFNCLSDRHAFAGFPLKLFAIKNQKKINKISEYFNYPNFIN